MEPLLLLLRQVGQALTLLPVLRPQAEKVDLQLLLPRVWPVLQLRTRFLLEILRYPTFFEVSLSRS
jgi:hypothetical protein